jgi:hypothetical protein
MKTVSKKAAKTAKKSVTKKAGRPANKKDVDKEMLEHVLDLAKADEKKRAVKEKEVVKAKEEKKEKQVQERDETQYKFNGETLGKGRFLLAIVTAWARAHKNATAEQIEKAWPHTLIHRYGVLAPLKDAKERSNPRKRYFIDEEKEVLEIGGKKYAVCNQITAAIIEKVIAHCKEAGMKVK